MLGWQGHGPLSLQDQVDRAAAILNSGFSFRGKETSAESRTGIQMLQPGRVTQWPLPLIEQNES